MNKSLLLIAAVAAFLCAAPVESQTLLMHEATCDPAHPTNCLTPSAGGTLPTGGGSSSLNITSAKVVKATPGYIATVSVIVAGSAAGTVNDVATTGGAATANQVFTIPNTVGVYTVYFPMAVGIVVVPGTGQTVAVSYN